MQIKHTKNLNPERFELVELADLVYRHFKAKDNKSSTQILSAYN